MVENWIERWRTVGDETAAEALYNHFHLRLFRLAYGLLGDRDDAEDVMQETLKYALEHIGRFDPTRAQFGSWLHTIAVSRARDKQRRKKTINKLVTQLWQRNGRRSAPSVETVVTQTQTCDSLISAVQTLPIAQREVVLLRYWSGYTFPEIGRIVGKSEGTVKSRLRLAHKQLQKIVDHPLQDGGF